MDNRVVNGKDEKFYYIKSGFIIDYKALSDIVTVTCNRFSVFDSEKKIETEFLIKYENKAVTRVFLEDAILCENTKENSIVGITYKVRIDDSNNASIDFLNSDFYEKNYLKEFYPISYFIVSTNQDLIGLLSQDFDKIIRSVQRNKIFVFKGELNQLSFKIGLGAVIAVLVLVFFTEKKSDGLKTLSEEEYVISRLEEVKETDVKSIIEGFLIYEKIKADSKVLEKRSFKVEDSINKKKPESSNEQYINIEFIKYLKIIFLIFILFLPLLLIFIYNKIVSNFYPFYVFNIGFYEKIFKKKEWIKEVILNTVILGFLVSMISGFIIYFFTGAS